MSKQNNVFLNINVIHALLSSTRPGGFTFSKSHKPEQRLTNQWKIVFLVLMACFSLYVVLFKGYDVADFGNITGILNSLVASALLFIVLSEPFRYFLRLRIWKIMSDLHECDLMVI